MSGQAVDGRPDAARAPYDGLEELSSFGRGVVRVLDAADFSTAREQNAAEDDVAAPRTQRPPDPPLARREARREPAEPGGARASASRAPGGCEPALVEARREAGCAPGAQGGPGPAGQAAGGCATERPAIPPARTHSDAAKEIALASVRARHPFKPSKKYRLLRGTAPGLKDKTRDASDAPRCKKL